MRKGAIFIVINSSETEGQAEKLNNLLTSQEPLPPCNLNSFRSSDPSTPSLITRALLKSHQASGGNPGSSATLTLPYRANNVTHGSSNLSSPPPKMQISLCLGPTDVGSSQLTFLNLCSDHIRQRKL